MVRLLKDPVISLVKEPGVCAPRARTNFSLLTPVVAGNADYPQFTLESTEDYASGDGIVEFIDIEIMRWSKHQPRKDIKNPTWFAMSNRILEDSKIFGLIDAEWKALLYIFSQASQQNSAVVKLNLTHAKRVCDIAEKTIISTISHLCDAGVTRMLRERYVSGTHAIRDTTLQDTTLHNNTNTADKPPSVLDFEEVYKGYPRKEGKAGGLRIFNKVIKTQSDLANLYLAITKYREHHKTAGTERKFIKHFSTFMGEWKDWLDPNHGVAEDFAVGGSPGYRTITQMIADGDLPEPEAL